MPWRDAPFCACSYTGPAYVPINHFLRQIARVSGEFRTALARDAQLSFTATVGLICSAIRKLTVAAKASHTVTTSPQHPLCSLALSLSHARVLWP